MDENKELNNAEVTPVEPVEEATPTEVVEDTKAEDTTSATEQIVTEYAPEQKKSNVYGIISLVAGILALIVCCCNSYVALVPAVLGVVFYFLEKKQNGKASGLALAGFICSIISLVISVISIIILLAVPSILENLESYLDEMNV